MRSIASLYMQPAVLQGFHETSPCCCPDPMDPLGTPMDALWLATLLYIYIYIYKYVVLHFCDLLAENIFHQCWCFRTLDLHWRHIDLIDLAIEAPIVIHPLQIHTDVRVRQGEPPLVFKGPQKDRIIQNTALGVAQDHVLALINLAEFGLARDHVVHKLGGVWTLNLDLPLYRNIPHCHMLCQIFVLLHEPAILWFDVRAGVVDLVVNLLAPRTRLLREMPVRPLANARVNEQARALSIEPAITTITSVTELDWNFARFEARILEHRLRIHPVENRWLSGVVTHVGGCHVRLFSFATWPCKLMSERAAFNIPI
jgi:hypothetical protein